MTSDAESPPSRTEKREQNRLAQGRYRKRNYERRMDMNQRLEQLKAEKESLENELGYHDEKDIPLDFNPQPIPLQTAYQSQDYFSSQPDSDCGLEIQNFAVYNPEACYPSMEMQSASEDRFAATQDLYNARGTQSGIESTQSVGSHYLNSEQQDQFRVPTAAREPRMTTALDQTHTTFHNHRASIGNHFQALPYGATHDTSGYLAYPSMGSLLIVMVPHMIPNPSFVCDPQSTIFNWNLPLLASMSPEGCSGQSETTPVCGKGQHV
jgi:hypothetical protein